MRTRVFFDSKHAAGVCLGPIQARTHVQLALARQQSMLSVQHRLRLTMQHVYGHAGNLVNVQIMLLRLAPSVLYPVITLLRWFRRNFDTSACFGSCNNIGEVLENYVTLELKPRRYFATGVSAVFLIGPSVTFTLTCTTCGILEWSCYSSRLAAPSNPSSMKLTWLRTRSRHFALDVLCYIHDSA